MGTSLPTVVENGLLTTTLGSVFLWLTLKAWCGEAMPFETEIHGFWAIHDMSIYIYIYSYIYSI